MPDLRIQTAIDNGDLPEDWEQLDLFTEQEPMSFGNMSITLNDIFNLTKFTELLEDNKKNK